MTLSSRRKVYFFFSKQYIRIAFRSKQTHKKLLILYLASIKFYQVKKYSRDSVLLNPCFTNGFNKIVRQIYRVKRLIPFFIRLLSLPPALPVSLAVRFQPEPQRQTSQLPVAQVRPWQEHSTEQNQSQTQSPALA